MMAMCSIAREAITSRPRPHPRGAPWLNLCPRRAL
jgi:hypothetical protein